MKGKGLSEACGDEVVGEVAGVVVGVVAGVMVGVVVGIMVCVVVDVVMEVYVVAILARREPGGVGIMLDIASEVRIRFAGFGERLGVRLILMVKVLAKGII